MPSFSCLRSWSRSIRLPALLLCALFPAGLAGAAEPALVADLVTAPAVDASARPRNFVAFQGLVYFAAEDDLHGAELWRTDGTADGTVRMTDACPGRCSAEPVDLAVAGGRLYFLAEDGATGREVWVSDGTVAGTRRLADICPGPCSALSPGFISNGFTPIAVGSEVFFAADDGTTGPELWKTDGTAAGTVRIADLLPGPTGSDPQALTAFDGGVVFAARDADHGLELWQTDGTSLGTRLLQDFCPGPCHSAARPLATTDERMLVEIGNPTAGLPALWVLDTDGNAAPDATLGGAHIGSTQAARWGSALLVSMRTPAGIQRLWRTDLTPAGSTLLGEYGDSGFIQSLKPAGARAFFVNFTTATGHEIWVTDGTAPGTREVLDLRPGSGPGGFPLSSFPSGLTAFGDRLVFSAFTEAAGLEPWISDGTAAGTLPLGDLVPGTDLHGPAHSQPFGYTALGDRLVFAADRPERDRELWASDGTQAGTALLRDLRRGTGGADPAALTEWHNEVYFAAAGFATGRKPWRSDGTAAGTAALDGVGTVLREPLERFVPFAGWLHFAAGGQVWRSAGRPGSTTPIAGPYERARNLVSAGGRLFLLAEADEPFCFFDCHELHRLLPGGAVELVEDIAPWSFISPVTPQIEQPAGSQGHDLTPLNGRLFLGADDGPVEEGGGGHGDEPWISDGTAAGTLLLADICPGSCDSGPRPLGQLTRRSDHLLFVAGIAGEPASLWQTDGTPAGTAPVATLPYTQSRPRESVRLHGRLYFLLRGDGGDELWATDGTAPGTVKVSGLHLAGGGSVPHFARTLKAAGGRLYLAVHHAATGEELWTSDGTAAGTHLVREIAPGPVGAAPQSFADIDGRLAFAAYEPATGLELWVSDGTPAGTLRLTDLAPGRDSSSPVELTAAGPLLFFAADDGLHGRELWTLPRAALGGPRKVLTGPLF